MIEKNKKDLKKVLFKPKRVLKAVTILRQLNKTFYDSSKKKPLLDDVSDQSIYLQLTLKKIPSQKFQRFIQVNLPNPLVNDITDVCLITGDLDKWNKKAEIEPDVLHYKELLKREDISKVSEVITLRQLRREYKPYEARRQLVGAYDIFLCDKKIAGVLPHTLGKSFFKKRKFPIQINMKAKNLKKEIEKAVSSTMFHITCLGNSCNSEVAKLSMKVEDIQANISACVDVLKVQLPGEWDNVLGLYVKLAKSKAIPLYMSFDNPNDVKLKLKRKKYEVSAGELSTLPNADVVVYPGGRVVVKSNNTGEENKHKAENKTEYAAVNKIKKRKNTSIDNELKSDEDDLYSHKAKLEKNKIEKDAEESNSAGPVLSKHVKQKKIKTMKIKGKLEGKKPKIKKMKIELVENESVNIPLKNKFRQKR